MLNVRAGVLKVNKWAIILTNPSELLPHSPNPIPQIIKSLRFRLWFVKFLLFCAFFALIRLLVAWLLPRLI